MWLHFHDWVPYRRSLFISAALIGCAALLSWLREQADTPPERRPVPPHTPDYWVENVSARIWDAPGLPHHQIYAATLSHFPDDDSAEITQPALEIRTADGPPWQVRAALGWMGSKGIEVVLKNGVTLDQSAVHESNEKPATHFETSELRLLPKQNYAETEHAVFANYGTSWIRAVGMQVWFQTPVRIKLLAQVRGHYE